MSCVFYCTAYYMYGFGVRRNRLKKWRKGLNECIVVRICEDNGKLGGAVDDEGDGFRLGVEAAAHITYFSP